MGNMKLVTLNAWGGRINRPLLDFVSANRTIDIFCFQEVNSNRRLEPGNKSNPYLFSDIAALLTGHRDHFFPVYEPTYGLAEFFSRGLKVEKRGEVTLYENPDFRDWDMQMDHSRKMSWSLLSLSNGKKLLVMNVHGHWVKNDKKDNEARLEQSRRILELMEGFDCPKILCGDFNLRPDTESVRMIESAGMRNLVTEYGITSTRTSLYTREEKFADYVFVSKDIQVKDFRVLPDEVSDHAPLFLDFEVM